jgi:hypothetical protein
MASEAFDTSEIQENEAKLSRMDAAAILYDEGLHQRWK